MIRPLHDRLMDVGWEWVAGVGEETIRQFATEVEVVVKGWMKDNMTPEEQEAVAL